MPPPNAPGDLVNTVFSNSASQDDAISQLHRLAFYWGILSGVLVDIAVYQMFESLRWVSLLVWVGVLIANVVGIKKAMEEIATMPPLSNGTYADVAARESRLFGGGTAYFIVVWVYGFVTTCMLIWLPIWWP